MDLKVKDVMRLAQGCGLVIDESKIDVDELETPITLFEHEVDGPSFIFTEYPEEGYLAITSN